MIGSEIFAFNVLIILVAVGLFVGVGLPCAIRSEKRGFNNGICPICGKKLEHFDDDSQGGVEDIAAHLQHIIISLGFHTNSLIKILVNNGTNTNT